jgi:hypothetical protein
MCIFNNFFGKFNILIIWLMWTINHHAWESKINAAFAELKCITMIKMKNNRNCFVILLKLFCIFNCSLCHITKKSLVSILTSTRWDLQNDWWFSFNACLDYCLKLLHLGEVVTWNCIAFFDSFFENVDWANETKLLIWDSH